MSYLKNTQTGRVVGDILYDSDVYEFLKSLVQAGGGSNAPRPLYEEISEATLEHLIAGDAENQLSTVPPLGETGWQCLSKMVGPLAAGVDATVQLGNVNSGGVITSIEYVPVSTITGEATNYRTLSVEDLTGTVTSGSEVLSSSAVVLTGEVVNEIVVATAAVAEGDALEWKSIHTGTGLADPGGLVIVTINGYTYSAPDYSNAGYSDSDAGGEG